MRITVSDKTESTSRTSGIGAFRPWRGAVFAPLFFWAGTVYAAETPPAGATVVDAKDIRSAEVVAARPPQATVEDLQNLVVCARMKLADLTPDQIGAVAVAIKHAEEDIAAMRKAAAALPPPAEAKK